VLIGLHKLSPLFPHDPDVTFNGGSGSGSKISAWLVSSSSWA
jgi:hypothetical protein